VRPGSTTPLGTSRLILKANEYNREAGHQSESRHKGQGSQRELTDLGQQRSIKLKLGKGRIKWLPK